METIEFVLPVDFASAFINGDYSGLEDSDCQAIDRFIEDMNKEFNGSLSCVDVESGDSDGSEGFMRDHDLQPYGVLACGCSTYTFVIHPND